MLGFVCVATNLARIRVLLLRAVSSSVAANFWREIQRHAQGHSVVLGGSFDVYGRAEREDQ